MCNWRKWIWPGILATVLLTALAMLMKSGAIEQDLRTKAMTDLAEGYEWASVELDGRDLTLTGVAPSEDAVTEALQIADDAYDVRVATANTTLLPIADPYQFTATKTADGITLEGSVPSEVARAEVVAAAEAAHAGAAITDNLEPARGAPDGFGDLAGFGISQLKMLDTGKMTINGLDLSISGEASDIAGFDAVKAALAGTIPGGGNIVGDEVTSPAIVPYPFSATKDDAGITLAGYVPDDTARTAIVEAAQSATSGSVVDNLQIGVGEPEGFTGLSEFAISQLGEFSTGSARLTDADLVVRGTALSPEAYDRVTGALSGEIPFGGKLAVADITRNTVSPYTFTAKKDKGIMVLEGFVGSSEAKTDMVSFAQSANPGDRVIDRLVIANGAPDDLDWSTAAEKAVSEAALLSKGEGTLVDSTYSLTGTARDNAAYDSLTGDTSLPSGLKQGDRRIERLKISPYVWTFTNTEGAAPALLGYVPEERLTTDNIAQIESRLGTAQAVANGIEIGAGAPANFAAATSVAIQAASRLFNGMAELTDTDLVVSGEAPSDSLADQIRAEVENGLPPGYSGRHNISVRSVDAVPALSLDACQETLDKELLGNVIRFESAKADIKQDSFGLLDRLAFIAKRCPTATIEIAGHTDSDGSDAANQTLSEARANAVRSYLVDSGIFVGRLKAVGYGETNPVADNNTEDGKAKNRRIEFNIIR